MNKITKNDENYFLANWLEGKITDDALKEKISDKEFLEYKKLKKSFDVISDLDAPLDKALLRIKSKLKIKKSNTSKTIPLFAKWAVAIAASIVLFFGISTFFENNDVIYYANYGEQKIVTLLDGSEVVLNAKSSLQYNKTTWKNKRILELDGEAYFKVTKGNTFTVNSKNGSVTVLGTQFNVNSKKDYYSVVCYEGKVRVNSNNVVTILTPGNGVENLNQKTTKLTIENNVPNWISGESTFENIPIRLVIDALEKQYNISINSAKINLSEKFTGAFNHTNLKLALASVFKPMNIRYKISGKTIILSNSTSL